MQNTALSWAELLSKMHAQTLHGWGTCPSIKLRGARRQAAVGSCGWFKLEGNKLPMQAAALAVSLGWQNTF